ncbi:putative RNA 2'-O-ribose methyltransferase [Proteus mirabilis]|uniref:Putative RNA 2'-O-ribose methyltransferase n=1 Tax=Proteus mirabilis TaxID=584 RepID=A0A379GB21_PROMI|nr:putative RNA 2'-O-ribose methyltransferase [Proteus mirabilis]
MKEGSGYVIFECYQEGDADKIARDVDFRGLIFARQLFVCGELLKELTTRKIVLLPLLTS